MSPWNWQVSFNRHSWLLLPVQFVLPSVSNHWLLQVRPFLLCVDEPAMMVISLSAACGVISAVAGRLAPIPAAAMVAADNGSPGQGVHFLPFLFEFLRQVAQLPNNVPVPATPWPGFIPPISFLLPEI